jgi:hypothetical protein
MVRLRIHHRVRDDDRHHAKRYDKECQDRCFADPRRHSSLEAPPCECFDQLVGSKDDWHRSKRGVSRAIGVSKCVDTDGPHDESGDQISFG